MARMAFCVTKLPYEHLDMYSRITLQAVTLVFVLRNTISDGVFLARNRRAYEVLNFFIRVVSSSDFPS